MGSIKNIKNLDNLKRLLSELPKFKYQKELTEKLDTKKDDFTYETILEIVLWKTNRFPEINDDLIIKINELRKGYNESLSDNILIKLLDSKGFDLPMASTFLRFINPDYFQIIDQRVYRILYGKNLKIPFSKPKKIELYKKYLIDLKMICLEYGIAFSESDRILYLLDKHPEVNKEQKIKY
ncbi:hypothetical protein CHRY9390_00946 [Chryseobacterium aquaeductus]|uniref:Uncharacterized protein n=1 Tax=Chryseobacterium aquaeductus TaxID=2675056 RepID=A0A9N8QRR8_9FLAO|nr:hypothetical protein [Chryseobacterium aquaeductus]CAA7330284.1 hypothetical protein CHRY9390_00946 [Chryseobacterium potabilaquae]CAD7802558.1 hypothetical protein CHRY9390_00946 [Chryseobacterium aquaeductus]